MTVDDAVLSNKAAELVFKEAIKVIPGQFSNQCNVLIYNQIHGLFDYQY